MTFSTRLAIRFGDTDPAGIVYYPHFFHYFHIAFEEFFNSLGGLKYHRLLAEERIGFPTVNVQAEFRQPLFYGDEAEIEVRVARLGNSSFTIIYSLRRVSDGALCARATNVHVAMNLDSRRAVPIPVKCREAFGRET